MNTIIERSLKPEVDSELRIVKKEEKFHFSKHNLLVLPCSEGIFIVPMEDVIYCQSMSNYTQVFTNDGQKILISKTLKWTEERVNGLFKRVHASFLINLLAVRKYDLRNASITLSNGAEVPVSRSMRKDFGLLFK